jgi:hypothetical protein
MGNSNCACVKQTTESNLLEIQYKPINRDLQLNENFPQ